jgi:hypothetical protein
MPGSSKINEWNSLKDQFAALVCGESAREDSIEKLFDDQIRRRFGEWITRAANSKSKAGAPYSSRARHSPRFDR